MKTISLLLAFALGTAVLANEAPRSLKEIESALKASPDNPMLHYRKCQALFAEGKEQKAIDHAGVALSKFKLAKDKLAWMRLGSIETEQYRIDVIYNMGPKERAEKKDGIVRPYSFRVWSLGDDSTIVQVIDFELGCMDGKVVSAAVGEMVERGHNNYGVVDPKSDFATVKKRVLDFLAR